MLNTTSFELIFFQCVDLRQSKHCLSTIHFRVLTLFLNHPNKSKQKHNTTHLPIIDYELAANKLTAIHNQIKDKHTHTHKNNVVHTQFAS